MEHTQITNASEGFLFVDEEDFSWTWDRILFLSFDVLLMLAILAGNVLTLSAIRLSRKISVLVSNQFIFNLALSDVLVGLSVPYHLAFYIHPRSLASNETTCILRFVLIILACSSSICNLLCIATDRYIAIVHPLKYNRFMTKKVALYILISSWLCCFAIASVPIYWNNWGKDPDWGKDPTCSLKVLTKGYLNFIMTPMFGSIWIAMYIVYFRIWREASGHAKRLRQVTTAYQNDPVASDSKSVQVVLLILGCFSICWLPYFILVTYIHATGNFENTKTIYEIVFTLGALNSCMNPIIYAWKNTNFRQAFWSLLRCKSISALNQDQNFITNHVPSLSKNAAINGSSQTIVKDEMNSDKSDKSKNTIKVETTVTIIE